MAILQDLLKSNEQNLQRPLTGGEQRDTGRLVELGGAPLQKQFEDEKLQSMAQKVDRSLGELNLTPNEQNVNNVVQAAAKGRPLEPRALISRRRAKLQKQIEDVQHSLRSDFSLHRMREAAKETLRLKGIAEKGGLVGKAAKAQLTRRGEGDAFSKIAQQKEKFMNDRLLGFQKQLLSLDGLENQVELADGLGGEIYQDQINALLTGAPLADFHDRKESKETTAIAKGRLGFDIAKEQFDQQEKLFARKQVLSDIEFKDREVVVKERKVRVDEKLADSDLIKANAEFLTASKLPDGVKKEVNTKLLDLQATLSTIDSISQSWNPEYFSALKKGASAVKQQFKKYGIDITDQDDATFAQNYSGFKGQVMTLFLQRLKGVFGGRPSDKEYDRIKEFMLNPDMSEDQAIGAFKELSAEAFRDKIIYDEMANTKTDPTDKAAWADARSRISIFDPRVQRQVQKAMEKINKSRTQGPETKQSGKTGKTKTPESNSTNRSLLLQVMSEKDEVIPPELLEEDR